MWAMRLTLVSGHHIFAFFLLLCRFLLARRGHYAAHYFLLSFFAFFLSLLVPHTLFFLINSLSSPSPFSRLPCCSSPVIDSRVIVCLSDLRRCHLCRDLLSVGTHAGQMTHAPMHTHTHIARSRTTRVRALLQRTIRLHCLLPIKQS